MSSTRRKQKLVKYLGILASREMKKLPWQRKKSLKMYITILKTSYTVFKATIDRYMINKWQVFIMEPQKKRTTFTKLNPF